MAKILVVDDEPEVRELICSVVKQSGHEAIAAADTAQAWDQMHEELQGIFVDIDMPGESGVEFVLRLRQQGKDIPVTFVTAYRDRARPLLNSGAVNVDVIDKPFRLEEVTAQLGKMLAL